MERRMIGSKLFKSVFWFSLGLLLVVVALNIGMIERQTALVIGIISCIFWLGEVLSILFEHLTRKKD